MIRMIFIAIKYLSCSSCLVSQIKSMIRIEYQGD